MADYLKEQHFTSSFKNDHKRSIYAHKLCKTLKKLECPFVESVDESWIMELVFKPGEPRIRILQWLLSKFHRSLYNYLDPIYSRPEVRLKAILNAASAIGLCSSTDLELIEGNTSMPKQMAFMDKLLGVVCVVDDTESCHSLSPSKYAIRRDTKLIEQFERDCSFMDSLVKQQSLDELFPAQISILPLDVKKTLERANHLAAERGEQVLPDIQKLAERATIVEEELCKQSEIFRQLQKEHRYIERDEGACENTMKKLRLVLSELHQMMVSYQYCYENHIQQWCNRDSPELSLLGEKIVSVHRLLSFFTTLVGSMKVVKSSHNKLAMLSERLEKQNNEESTKKDEMERLYQTLSDLNDTINNST